jgi:hypothetical protein
MQNAKTSFIQQTNANEQMSINSQPSFNEVKAENIFTMEQVMNEINTLPQNDNGEIDSDDLIALVSKNSEIAKRKLLEMTNRSDVNERPALRDGDLTVCEKGMLSAKSGLFAAIQTFLLWETLLGVLESRSAAKFFLTNFTNKTLWENISGQILWAISIEFTLALSRPIVQAAAQSGNLLAHYIRDERLLNSLSESRNVYELLEMIEGLQDLDSRTKEKIKQKIGDSGTNFNLAGIGTSEHSTARRLTNNYFNQTANATNYSISNAYNQRVNEGQYRVIAAGKAISLKAINTLVNFGIKISIPNFIEDGTAGFIERIGGNFTHVSLLTSSVQGLIEAINTSKLLTLDKVYNVGVQERNGVSEVGSQAWRKLSQYGNIEYLLSSANQALFRVFGRLLFEFTIRKSFLDIHHSQAMSLYEGLRAGVGMHGSKFIGQSLFNLISKQCKTLPKNINLGLYKFREDINKKINSIDVMIKHLIKEIDSNQSNLEPNAVKIRSNLLVSLTNAKREFQNIRTIIAEKEKKYKDKPQNQYINEPKIGNLHIDMLELIGSFTEASEILENTQKTVSIICEQQKDKKSLKALQESFKEIFSDFNEQELCETIGTQENDVVNNFSHDANNEEIAMVQLNSSDVNAPNAPNTSNALNQDQLLLSLPFYWEESENSRISSRGSGHIKYSPNRRVSESKQEKGGVEQNRYNYQQNP